MMVIWMKQGCWLFLAVLVVGQLSGCYSRHAMGRNRRQTDHWWRAHQSVSGLGSPRRAGWGSAGTGFSMGSHTRHLGADYHSGYDWGSSRMYIEEAGQSRQQQPVAHNPASVVCNEDNMVVTVQRDLYGNGKLVKASDLSLGPQKCKPDAPSSDATVVFTVDLQECGNTPKMTADMLTYSTFLSYNPSAANLPITRTNAAKIEITCYYPRHDNVSSETIHPTWVPFSATATYEAKLNFSLRLMNGDWSGPSPSIVFELGDPLNIEASVDTDNHIPMRILVDRCVATLQPNVAQGPSYDIISFNGCLVDGKQEDSNSAFITPRVKENKIQFTVDAFKFTNVDSSVIFFTCFLRTVASDAPPNATNKACSYSKTSNSWLPVEGPSSICSCCELGNCVQTAFGSRRLTSTGGSRRPWKRGAVSSLVSENEEWPATIGPLYIVGADSSKTLQMTGSSMTMEIWMVAGVCSLWLVVVLACILVWKIKPKNTVRP